MMPSQGHDLAAQLIEIREVIRLSLEAHAIFSCRYQGQIIA